MEKHALLFVLLQYSICHITLTVGIITNDIEEKFIKAKLNATVEKTDSRFQIFSQAFGVCAGVDDSAGYAVNGQTCNASSATQIWHWINKKQIRHVGSGKCLDIIGQEIATKIKLSVKACNSKGRSQQWTCHGLFLQVGGTNKKMNYGNSFSKPYIALYDIADGSFNEWLIYKTTNSTLCSINPYNQFLKITTATSKPFCSIECAKEKGCRSFIFLEYKESDNCLLSSDPDGNHSMSYDGASFVKLPKIEACDHTNCQRGSTCVPVTSTSRHYACICPPWASGFHCENLKSGYDHSLLAWKTGAGFHMKTVDSAYQTWITNKYGSVFWLYENHPAQGEWINEQGNLKQITVGLSGVYGVASDDSVFERIGVDSTNPTGSAWLRHSNISLSQITSGNLGVIWGINRATKLFYRNGATWSGLDVGYKWVSCGKFGCWAIRTNGTTTFRTGVTTTTPGGVAWVETGGSFKQLDTGVRGEAYAIDDAGRMYTREGISESLSEGTKWSQFGNMLFSHVSVGDRFLCGLTSPSEGGKLYTL